MNWTANYSKAITFSFDDGVLQDQRLVELLNRYHLKCTFNINSGLGRKTASFQYKSIEVSRFDLEELVPLYQGHEVAMHSLSHPVLTNLSIPQIKDELFEDQRNIELVFHQKVMGMAYPFGQYDDRVIKVLRSMKIRYARTIEAALNFYLPADLYRFHPTAHFLDPKLSLILKAFFESNPTQPIMLCIWGHSFELESDDGWNYIESLFKELADHPDVFYGTNAEVLLLK